MQMGSSLLNCARAVSIVATMRATEKEHIHFAVSGTSNHPESPSSCHGIEVGRPGSLVNI